MQSHITQLDVRVFPSLVASIIYTPKKSHNVALRLKPALVGTTVKQYVKYSSAENIMHMHELGFDILESYLFLSCSENVFKSRDFVMDAFHGVKLHALST